MSPKGLEVLNLPNRINFVDILVMLFVLVLSEVPSVVVSFPEIGFVLSNLAVVVVFIKVAVVVAVVVDVSVVNVGRTGLDFAHGAEQFTLQGIRHFGGAGGNGGKSGNSLRISSSR